MDGERNPERNPKLGREKQNGSDVRLQREERGGARPAPPLVPPTCSLNGRHLVPGPGTKGERRKESEKGR